MFGKPKLVSATYDERSVEERREHHERREVLAASIYANLIGNRGMTGAPNLAYAKLARDAAEDFIKSTPKV